MRIKAIQIKPCEMISLLAALVASAVLADPTSSKPISNPHWQPVPIITQAERDAGISPGGEGDQLIRSLAISDSDPSFVMMGTDVGGIYRSVDGGGHWQVCMVSWNARGGDYFAIDPRNPMRVLGTGANGGHGNQSDGLYLSTNQGASWQEVILGGRGLDWRDSLAYDPASFNKKLGYCTRAYFDSFDKGLYRTDNGGKTWTVVNSQLSAGVVKVDSASGTVYLGFRADAVPDHGLLSPSPHPGLFVSHDGGVHFDRIFSGPVLAIDPVAGHSGRVVISIGNSLMISMDSGAHFQPLGSALPQEIEHISLCASDPSHMVCSTGIYFRSHRYASSDSGRTWQEAKFLGRKGNMREGLFAWDARHANILFSTGGDFVTKSTDSGLTYSWSSNGENAVMVGSSLGFNPASPDTLFLAFQDSNAAITQNAGYTWTRCNVSGQDWGGMEYAGLALSSRVMWSGDAQDWGTPRTLKVSRNGGRTWTPATAQGGGAVVFAGPDVSSPDPADPLIGFASNWRTADGGRTWDKMDGCDCVFTASYTKSDLLYGAHGREIVVSDDHGATWRAIGTAPGSIDDIACDPTRGRLYIACDEKLFQWESGILREIATPSDQYGNTHIETVATDPANPSVVYAGGPANMYTTDHAIIRSIDGGRTWANLTVTHPLPSARFPGGPHEVQWVRVDPKTRMAWVGTGCFGVWKIAPP